MKILQSSLVRAIVAFVVGALIIKYREETVHWLTIVIGALFFVSGIVSVVLNRRPTPLPLPAREGSDYSQGDDLQAERHSTPLPHREGQGGGSAVGGSALASLVGFGSIILGIILALMPTTFITGLQYVLAAMLVLGAINQFVNLAQASRWCSVGWFYWLLPVVVLIVAVFMIWRPIETAAAPLFIIGWCMLLYGMAELLGGIMVWKANRIVKRMAEEELQQQQTAQQAAQEAETVEYVEVKE
ncbi:MAG: DUF308 domain-containing protein [Prevotella sp.]|nr:DUF308 domain-containing protein [Prevotella sp.]